MYSVTTRLRNIAVAGALACLFMAASPASLFAQYVKLQVLLPGETAAPGTGTGKLGAPTPQTVGTPFTITVRACDATWNTVPTITNIVSITSSNATATLPPATSLVNGQKQLSVTLNAAGSFTFTADDNSDPTIALAVSANVTAYLLDGFEFSTINQKNQYAGQPMSITVRAVDPNGSVVPFSGAVILREITSFGEGRISPSIVNLTNGTWSGNVTNYRADETSINRGNVNIQAELPSNPSINGFSDPFTVHPGPFSRLQIIVPGQSPLPGSVSGLVGSPASQSATQTFAVQIYATDAYWNPLPSGDVVRLTSSDPAANTPINRTLSNGFVQIIVSLGTVGTQTLTISDQTNGSIQGMTSAGIPVIASGAHHFEIDPVPSPLTAGQSVNVRIRATDAGGNTVTSFSGNAVLIAITGPGSISPELVAFTAGEWTGSMVFRGAGATVSFTCSDFASPPHTGTSNNFEVRAGTYVKLQVLLPGQTPAGGTSSGFTGTPTNQTAGSPFSVTVKAVDQFWNRVPGVNNLISVVSSDSFAVLPADTNLINGEIVFTARLFKAGQQTITARDLDAGGITPHTSSPVTIIGGSYSRIVIIAPGQFPAAGAPNGQGGTATEQSITFAFTISVYATDQWYNPVGGASDLIQLTSTDGAATIPPSAPMQDGRVDFSVRLRTGGFQLITARNVTQPTMPTSSTQVEMIQSGFHLEAEVSPTNVQAGEPFNLTVKVTNSAGAVIQEINSLVSVVVENASTQAPGRGTLLNTHFQLLQGQRTMPETYTFAEDIVLHVTDDAGNDEAVTDVISVSPGPPTKIALSSNPTWVGGNKKATISARLLDDWDNGVPAQPMAFTLLTGQGSLAPLDSATNAAGTARATFRSDRFPIVSRIRASSNGVSAEMNIETALFDPNKEPGTITNYPNPFHPSESPTTIAYKLADNADVTIRIYTLVGGLVYEKKYGAGTQGGMTGLNEVTWNGRNGKNESVSSGGYICVVEANSDGETLHVMKRKIGVVN